MNENARKAAMYAELYNPKTPVVHVDLFAELKKELAEARAEIENLHWRVSDEQAKTRAALELNSKALELVNEARARIDHLKSIIDEMTEEQASLCAEGQSITELVAAKDKLIEQMREALRLADDLIDEYAADYEHRDNVDEVRDEIKAALSAAERGE